MGHAVLSSEVGPQRMLPMIDRLDVVSASGTAPRCCTHRPQGAARAGV